MKPSRVLGRAISAARKRIRILPEKKLNENLDFACGSLAEAYEVGVQEAQMEIVDRLLALEAKLQRAESGKSEPFEQWRDRTAAQIAVELPDTLPAVDKSQQENSSG